MTAHIAQNPEQFFDWLTNFEAAVRAHRGKLGIDDAMMAQIVSMKGDVGKAIYGASRAEIGASDARERAAEAQRELAAVERACAEVHEARRREIDARAYLFRETIASLRPIAEQVQERRSSPRRDSVLTPHPISTRISLSASAVRPIAPAALVVTAQQKGVNILQWSAIGNGQSTTYSIEATIGAMYRGSPVEPEASGYKVVGTVDAGTAFSHSVGRVTAGVRVRYRVRAIINGVASGYSNEVTVTSK